MITPVVACGLDFHDVGDFARHRRWPVGATRVGRGDHDHRRNRAACQTMAEELAGVVAKHGDQAGRLRWSGNQRHGFTEAQARTDGRFAEDFDPGTARARTCREAAVSGAADFHRGLRTAVEDFAGHGKEVGLNGPGRTLDTQEVIVERAAGDRFAEVRITHECLDGTGVRIHFGVRPVDAAKKWPDLPVECPGKVARCADADVAGDVDRPAARCGDVDCFHAVRVGDGVGARDRYVHPHANPREAGLIAVDRVFRSERRFNPGHVGIHAITSNIVDAGLGEEPERFRWPVIREHHRQGVVENAGLRIQDAHIGGGARSTRCPRAGSP
ncbi:hypothetical protein D3C84_596200 [compost metagenome]